MQLLLYTVFRECIHGALLFVKGICPLKILQTLQLTTERMEVHIFFHAGYCRHFKPHVHQYLVQDITVRRKAATRMHTEKDFQSLYS